MSFFDDEPEYDEPTRATRPAQPRRPGGARASSGGGGGEPDYNRRRIIAIAALLLVLLAAFGLKSCYDSSRRDALKDYNEQVTELTTRSTNEVSRPLFALLTSQAERQNATATANRIRSAADKNAQDARDLDVPGEASSANRNLELVLNLRAGATKRIAADIGAALGEGRAATAAIRRIAGQMQAFMASDVIYSQRVQPLLREALDGRDLQGTQVARSQFLPALGWLDFNQAAKLINADAGGAGTDPTGEPKPGLHGHGLVSVAIGDTTLTSGGDAARVATSSKMALTVKIANQGDNDEANVKVSAKVQPSSTGRAFSLNKAIPQTKAGTEAEVSMPFPQTPAKGSTAKITVTVQKVGGEKKLENNTQTFSVYFN